MKKLIACCFMLFAVTAMAQAPDTLTPEKNARWKIGRIRDNTVRAITPQDFRNAFNALANLAVKRVPYLTQSEVRAGKADTASVVQLVQGSRSGSFRYDPTDTTTPDDTAMVLVTSNGRRYKRDWSRFVDVRWFGAVADYNTTTGTGTDNTEAFRKATDYAATFQGGEVHVPKGRYGLRYYEIKNASLIGFVKVSFYALPSSEKSFFRLAEGVVQNIVLRDFGLRGNSANHGQILFDIKAKRKESENTGGWWYSQMENVDIMGGDTTAMNFESLDPLVAGTYRDIANQFLTFNNVRAFRSTPKAYALRSEGQFGQITFNNCQFDGSLTNAQNSVNVYLISSAVSTNGTDEAYSIDFNTCTFQSGDRGVRTYYARGINFNGCHWENMARPLSIEANSYVNVDKCYFGNSGKASLIPGFVGDAGILTNAVSFVNFDDNFINGSFDNVIVGNSDYGTNYGTGNNISNPIFKNTSFQTSVAANNELNIEGHNGRIILNANANVLKTIKSRKGIAEIIVLEPLGNLTIASGGNIRVRVGLLTSTVFRAGQSAILRSEGTSWVLINPSESYTMYGTGLPEGNVVGNKGMTYARADAGANAFYIKTTQDTLANNTGWQAVETVTNNTTKLALKADLIVINNTATPFTVATLNSTYPSMPIGSQVDCPVLGVLYIKESASTWGQVTRTTVSP